MAGVALADIDRHFAWRAWHLATSTLTLHGRRGTYGTGSGGGLGSPFGAVVAAVGVAGVALGDISRHFVWQVWHLLWHWTGSGGPLGSPFGAVFAAAVGVAGVALGYLDLLHFAWQVWHLATSSLTLRGRRGAYGTGIALRQTKLFHTTLSQIPFTHNFVTQTFHTHTHNFVTHNFVTHTHTHNSFTHNSFTHNFVTYISFTYNLLHTTLSHTTLSHTTLLHAQTYTDTHTHTTLSHTHTSFTQPVLHHLLSFLPFPSHFHICL